jgi:hypothetical protein
MGNEQFEMQYLCTYAPIFGPLWQQPLCHDPEILVLDAQQL